MWAEAPSCGATTFDLSSPDRLGLTSLPHNFHLASVRDLTIFVVRDPPRWWWNVLRLRIRGDPVFAHVG
jgi:hypothetical protein